MSNYDHTRSPIILTVPGLDNSGPDHWQSLWERDLEDCHRIELGMWENPNRNSWANKINLAIQQVDRPVVLVAHSLGCHAVAWWATLERPAYASPVIGALLVAPAETDQDPLDDRLSSFAPSPIGILPFPSILVASQNDPYMSLQRARRLATLWGSEFVNLGLAGHINADSILDDWPTGKALLRKLAAPNQEDIHDKMSTEEAYQMTSYWSVSGAFPI